jgi:tripartite-type tricarboxylate transporter receptor subunit TctC
MHCLLRHLAKPSAGLSVPAPPPRAPVSAARGYPARPIRMIAGYVRSSVNRSVTRLLANQLSIQFRQSIVIDDRPTMSGTLGLMTVARAAPDGYTLLVNSTQTMNIAAHLCDHLSHGERNGGFVPVALMSRVPRRFARDLRVVGTDVRGLVDRLKACDTKVDGFYAPPGTPGAIVDKLARALRAAVRGPEVEALLFKKKTALVLLTGPALYTFCEEQMAY